MLPADYVQLLGIYSTTDVLDKPHNGDSSMKTVMLLGNKFRFFPYDSHNVEVLPLCIILLFFKHWKFYI